MALYITFEIHKREPINTSEFSGVPRRTFKLREKVRFALSLRNITFISVNRLFQSCKHVEYFLELCCSSENRTRT